MMNPSLSVIHLARGHLSRKCFHARSFSLGQSLDAEHSFKVVVVGGGSGGCSAAAKYSRKLGKGSVAVVEPSDVHAYQPGWTLVGAGIKDLGWSLRPMGDVLPKKATWIKDSVVSFEPEQNRIVTESGDTINYEFLVVAMGITLRYDKIKGLPEAFETPGVCSNYSAKYVEKTRKAIEDFQGGTAVFTLPPMPIKCPGAPQKIMYLAQEAFKKRGLKADLLYFTTTPAIFGVKKYADALWKVVESRRNITVNLAHNLTEVRSDSKTAVFKNLSTGEEVIQGYDMLHITPPMSPPTCLSTSPGLADQAGFLDVNKHTLQHTKYQNIFGVGDCTNIPTSKTAAAVAGQMHVLRRNLDAAMSSKPMPATYDGYTSCPLVTGTSSCIMAEFDFQAPPQPLETFPIDQGKERRSMYHVKAEGIPFVYWNLMLKGWWEGPSIVRKLLHGGK